MNLKISFSVVMIIYFMLSLTLMIDFLNGFFPMLHIGEIFRILLLALCSMQLISNSINHGLFLISIIIFLIFNIACAEIFGYNSNCIQDIAVAIKSTIVFVISSTLILLYKRGKLNFTIENVLYNNMLYGPLLLIMSSVFGFGVSSYSWDNSGIGTKGTFLSLNSINVALMILYMFSIYNVTNLKSKVKWTFFSIYIAVPMVLLGTKTSFLILFFAPILFIVLNKDKNNFLKCLIVFFVFIGIAFVFQSYILEILEPIISRQLYLMEARDLSTYLFSTRNTRVMHIFDLYFSDFTIFEILCGKGYSVSHFIFGIYDGNVALPIEMDFVDIFVSYGLIGMIFTYFYSMLIIYLSEMQCRKGTRFFFWSALVVLIYGTMAGHVFLEAISSTFFAIILAGLYISSVDDTHVNNT